MLIANSLIAAVTLLLFVLWFRYMCSMLLAAQTSLDRSTEVAQSNALIFADVLRELFETTAVPAATLHLHELALHRDLEILTYLLRHMGQTTLGDSGIEVWLLTMDFHLQSMLYKMLPWHTQERVYKMATILCYFANTIGERTVPSRS